MLSAESKPPIPKIDRSSISKKRKRSPIKSIGTKLLLAIIGGAVVGLGGTAYLFDRTLEGQATEKIQTTLTLEVREIETELTAVTRAATDLGTSVQFFQELGVQDKQVYEALTLKFFRTRPQWGMAAYFFQTNRGILQSQEWYYPYFYLDQKTQGQLGTRLPAPDDNIIYSELFQDDNYPIRDYYKVPVARKADTWVEPFPWYGNTVTTFTTPIFDREKRLIGFSGMDVNVTTLEREIPATVINNAGFFTLLSEQGKILSYSPDPKKAIDRANYDTVPELKEIWTQIGTKETGFIRSGDKYWAFRRLPTTNWLLIASVPVSVVQMPVLEITLAGTLGAGLILAGTVFWFIRGLNKKLAPIVGECENLADLDPKMREAIRKSDEIEGLSISLFELLRQLKAERERVQQQAEARLTEVKERLRLSEEVEKESEILQTEIGQILDVVATLEKGDFTIKATVSNNITGLVADNLNRFVEEISYTLSTVFTVARQVSDSAQLLEELAQDVAGNATQQAQGATMALQLTKSVDKSARDSSQKLVDANLKLDRVNQAVEEGQTEMQMMGLAINSLQQGQDQMLQQMTTLGEFVNTAEQFVEEQGQIASLSQTLAMSANLLAARASEQKDPRQFLSVAREFGTIAAQMKTLAQQTNTGLNTLQKRTETVRSAVSTVGKEVENMAGLVENFTDGVDRSQKIFNRVDRATNELMQAEDSISQSNQTIVNAAQSSAKAMNDIAILASQTAHLTQTTNQQSEVMKQLSLNLIQALSLFRLPERKSN
jgi:methyl-accepting chemotaxis protein PixJ